MPCNEMLLNHLAGGVGIVAGLALVSDVHMDCSFMRIEIGFCTTDVVALGAWVAPLRDVLVFAVHVRLQVAFGCTPVLTVLTLEPAVFIVDLFV